MSKWYIYILTCRDNSLYTGITTDIARRMKEHASGKGSRYVRSKGFGHLSYFEVADDRSLASKREYEIKSLPRLNKLKLINSQNPISLP